jgi:hypothetical protein
VGKSSRLRNRIIYSLTVAIAIKVEADIYPYFFPKTNMATQDLLLLVLLLCPGLLLSVTIMLTFAAGG